MNILKVKSVESEKQWSDEFNSNLYYSHGKTNSCRLLIAFLGDIAFPVKAQGNDSNRRILILKTDGRVSEFLNNLKL